MYVNAVYARAVYVKAVHVNAVYMDAFPNEFDIKRDHMQFSNVKRKKKYIIELNKTIMNVNNIMENTLQPLTHKFYQP